MGTDIHHNEEVFKNGDWHSLRTLVDNPYYEEYPEDEPKLVLADHEVRLGRNYNLFAVLADVRNGRGFAGSLTSAGFNIISEPRGAPGDIAVETRYDLEQWDVDAHSVSWLTLKEILDFDWNQTATLYGMVSWPTFVQWMQTKTAETPGPRSYCGDVGGQSINKFSVEYFEMLFQERRAPSDPNNAFARVSWEVSYRSAVGKVFWDYVEYLKTLGEPENVRMVFWFDN